MSSGDDIKVSYYSALLARALSNEDGDLFTDLYDQIVRLVTKDEADLAVEKARQFSNLSPPTLESRIKWFESLGVKKLLPTQPVVIATAQRQTPESPVEYLVEEQVLYEESPMSDDASGNCRPDLLKLYEQTFRKSTPEERVNKFIDDDEEVMRGSLQPIPTFTDNKKNVCVMEEEPEDCGEETLLSTQRSKKDDCVINIEDNVDFGLPGYQQRNESFFSKYDEPNRKNCNYKDIEMDEMGRENRIISPRQGNPVEELHPMQSPDSDEDSSELNKKVKKKKKRKAKQQGVGEILDCEPEKLVDDKAVKSSRNTRRKKYNEARKTNSSLECPNINRQSPERGKREEKPKRRTIKAFQEEKERKREQHMFSADSKTDLLSTTDKRNYGSTSRENKPDNSQLLNDETLNKILKDLGEGVKITETKKKSKDSKKDKKKNKKPKKTGKENTKDDSNENVGNSPVDLSAPISSFAHINQVAESLSGEDGEFVTQKKSRRSINRGNQLNSDRSSAHDNDGGNEPHDQSNTLSASVVHVYDRENEVQWPTLPAMFSSNMNQTANARANQGSSYASKLKSNLDSTGCSLASSSEDGASSSSSSSGGGIVTGGGGGRLSPSNDLEFHDILSGVSSAVAAATKRMNNFAKYTSNPLPAIQPSCVNLKPAVVVEVAKKCDKDITSVVVTKLDTSPTDDVKEGSVDEVDLATDNKSEVEAAPGEEAEVNQFPEGVVEIFENQWGLEFIMDKRKVDDDKSTVIESSTDLIKETPDHMNELTFECTLVPSQDANSTELIKVLSEVLLSCYDMRMRGDLKPWNDPGHFDIDGAANFFLNEWNDALKCAIYSDNLKE